jgi:hypothetical protein
MTKPDDPEAATPRALVDLETARTSAWLERDKARLAALLDLDFVEMGTHQYIVCDMERGIRAS